MTESYNFRVILALGKHKSYVKITIQEYEERKKSSNQAYISMVKYFIFLKPVVFSNYLDGMEEKVPKRQKQKYS